MVENLRKLVRVGVSFVFHLRENMINNKASTQLKQHILQKAFGLLRERYPMGLYEYFFKYEPEVYKIKASLEERIDEVFLAGSVNDLEAVLRTYWALHVEMISEFENAEHSQMDLPLARKEYDEQHLHA